MIIFEKYQLLQKLIGLHPNGGYESIIVRITYLFVFMSFCAMEVIIFILNVRDGINRALNAICALSGVVPPMTSYGHLLINRERYYSVLRKMQEIVNESTSS